MDTAFCVLSISIAILYLVKVWLQNRPSQSVARRQHDACDTVLRCLRRLLKGKTYFKFSLANST